MLLFTSLSQGYCPFCSVSCNRFGGKVLAETAGLSSVQQSSSDAKSKQLSEREALYLVFQYFFGEIMYDTQ